MGKYDIAANRKASKWAWRELAGRALWEFLRRPLFAWTPRQAWGLRSAVLRRFGARIGVDVRIYPSVDIAVPWNLEIGDQAAVGDRAILYSLGPVTIGPRATVSQYAYLCAGSHDHRQPDFPLLKPPIVIGADAWVCADAFVGPGVTIGERAILGARGVAVRDISDGDIAVGNPARPVSRRGVAAGS